jgi:hypothetical protein
MRGIIDNQSPAKRVCSQGLIYWSHNDACAQVLGWEHSSHVRRVGVGLGPTPGKFTSRQGSISSAPTLREQVIAAKMERLKTLYEAQNVQIQEQNNKYATQEEEMATVKRMLAMIMMGKQPSMGNNQHGDVLV